MSRKEMHRATIALELVEDFEESRCVDPAQELKGISGDLVLDAGALFASSR